MRQLQYMQKNLKISVIYVNYKSGRHLIESIESVFKSKPKLKYEIIVVDNSPKDLISKKLKKLSSKIVYIKNTKNTGYGAGNNLGIKRSKGEYVFVLNPDTLINKSTVDILAKFLDKNKKVAIVAPNLLVGKGILFENMGSRTLTPLRAIFSLTFVEKIFPNNKFKKVYRLEDISKDMSREVGAVPGSAFMIKKKIFNKVGKFDENIFMYFEESDLGKRIKDSGYKIFIEPKARVIHKWVGKKDKSKKLQKYFNENPI